MARLQRAGTQRAQISGLEAFLSHAPPLQCNPGVLLVFVPTSARPRFASNRDSMQLCFLSLLDFALPDLVQNLKNRDLGVMLKCKRRAALSLFALRRSSWKLLPCLLTTATGVCSYVGSLTLQGTGLHLHPAVVL